MLETWLALLALGAIVYTWSRAQASAERARTLAAQVCRQARVQLLDQTVSLDGLALRRAKDGRVRLLRRYRYEYSRDGDDRHRGGLALLGDELVWMHAPDVAPDLAGPGS